MGMQASTPDYAAAVRTSLIDIFVFLLTRSSVDLLSGTSPLVSSLFCCCIWPCTFID